MVISSAGLWHWSCEVRRSGLMLGVDLMLGERCLHKFDTRLNAVAADS
ncbi:MAG: hypothetical protein RL591_85 [Planctomycetota bacterium]